MLDLRVLAGLLLTVVSGCASQPARSGGGEADVAAMVQILSPREIRIQKFLTQPRAFGSSETPNGVEVLLAAVDAFGDPVKCVGQLQFELYAKRLASGDPLGQRVGYWSIALSDQASIARHWERYSRFYRFELRLSDGALAPGRYILTASFAPPGGDRIEDQYEFESFAPIEPGPGQ